MRIAVCMADISEQSCYVQRMQALAKESGTPVQISPYSYGKQLLFEVGFPEHLPDIIYLDVALKDISGIKTAQMLREMNYGGEIIFMADNDDHWQQAFYMRGFHYIVKSECMAAEFSKVFFSAIRKVYLERDDLLGFYYHGKLATKRIKEIDYIEIFNRIAIMHSGLETTKFYSSLNDLEALLRERGFLRIHRSYLVAVSKIVRARYTYVLLKDGEKLPVGRKYTPNIRDYYGRRTK